MRLRMVRLVGVPIMSLFLGLQLAACSGSEQDQEGLEVQDQQGQNEYGQENEYNDQQGNEYANQQDNGYGYQDQGENGYDNQEYADEQLGDENISNEYDTGDDMEYAGNETENDLQEIISEMNGEGDAVVEDTYTGTQDVVDAGAGYGAADPMMTPATDPMMAGGAAMASAGPSVPFQPGGTPAGQGIPEMGSKMAYIVQPGDTLAQISQKVYGNMGRWKEMASLSGMANPSRIYPGDVVYYTLDDASIPFATAYESVTRSEEQVQAGDTLGTIASRVYGTMKGWKAIWRQNDNIDNPDVVSPGTVVYYISSNNLAQEVAKQRAYFASLKTKQQEKLAVKANDDAESVVSEGILLADGRFKSSYLDVRYMI